MRHVIAHLQYENRNAEGATQGARMDRHLGTTCQSCRMSPIEGKCYRYEGVVIEYIYSVKMSFN